MEYTCTITLLCLCVFIVLPGSVVCQPINNSTDNCTTIEDCPSDQICVESQCVDPCQGVCGINTVCVVQDRVPMCYCEHGYQGDPFIQCTLGECMQDSDCSSDKTCVSSKCVDACQGVCGLNTECKVVNHRPVCGCLRWFVFTSNVGCAPSSIPECQTNSNCPDDRSCRLQKCVDPCEDNPCGNNTICQVKNHYPVCSCQVGYIGNAFNDCVPLCSSNPIPKGNKTFTISSDQRSWYDALDYCYSSGKKLATINSEAEWKVLTAAYNSTFPGNAFWLGGHDLDRYGAFRWVTDGNFLTYNNWRSGEPNGQTYHCLSVYNDFTWVSQTCTNSYYFVCESIEY